jgi:hypothetical protein
MPNRPFGATESMCVEATRAHNLHCVFGAFDHVAQLVLPFIVAITVHVRHGCAHAIATWNAHCTRRQSARASRDDRTCARRQR